MTAINGTFRIIAAAAVAVAACQPRVKAIVQQTKTDSKTTTVLQRGQFQICQNKNVYCRLV